LTTHALLKSSQLLELLREQAVHGLHELYLT
jgi:hypothetical protein